uniref:SGS domain-containing protein n=1 Tax=Sphenodon punctatus TaxID=8508 RepID=A0A8D0L1Q0_SPHPU
FPDSDLDPAAAAQKLLTALEQRALYCQRAYAHVLLHNYHDAIADAKSSLELDSNNATAFLRKGIKGQKWDSVDTTFTIWINRCEETLNRSQTEVDSQQQTVLSKIKYDWYQTESHVIITIMIKNSTKDGVNVQFSERELNALQSIFKVLSIKIEIKMKKPEAIRWEMLEGQGDSPMLKQITPDPKHLYPSSSHYTRNWDQLVIEIKEEEKNEKLEGDAALNKLSKSIQMARIK